MEKIKILSKQLLLVVFLLLCAVGSAYAQTGKFGTNNRNVDLDAVFEFSSRSQGLLIPRVPLTSTLSPSPLSAHKEGMIVYNDSTANDVVPGLYYNDGTKWVKPDDVSSIVNIIRDSTSAWYENNTILQDSIYKTIVANSDTLLGDNYIIVTGGENSVLDKVVLALDLDHIRDSLVNNQVFRDSITNMVTDSINTIIASTSDSLVGDTYITVTGGDSSVLSRVDIALDMDMVRDTLVNNQVFRDSITNMVTDSINTIIASTSDSLVGDTYITVTGGDSSVLSRVDLALDMDMVRDTLINDQEFRDSITTVVNNNIVQTIKDSTTAWYTDNTVLHDSVFNTVVTNSDSLIGDSYIMVKDGDSSVLRRTELRLDLQMVSDSLVSQQYFRDSITNMVTDSISTIIASTSDSLVGDAYITVTGGDSSVLSRVDLALDMDMVRDTLVNNQVFRDSITNMVTDSINTIIASTSDSLVGDTYITVTGGDSSVLSRVDLALDMDMVRDTLVNNQEFRDSITNMVTDSINTIIAATSDSLVGDEYIMVTGGDSSVLSRVALELDLTKLSDSLVKEPWYSTTTNTGATSNTDSVYIMGKVGIGTTTPGYQLDVDGMFNQTDTLTGGQVISLHSGNNVAGFGLNGVGMSSANTGITSTMFTGDASALGGFPNMASAAVRDFSTGAQAYMTNFNAGGEFVSELGYQNSFAADTVAISTYRKNNITSRVSNGTQTNDFVITDSSIAATQYPSSRNDTATTQPINFLYTDANGQFLSAPISVASSATEPWYSTTTNTGATTNTDSVYMMGKVGIGTATPDYQLDVDGMLNQTDTLASGQVVGIHSGDNALGFGMNGASLLSNTSGITTGVFAGNASSVGGPEHTASMITRDFSTGEQVYFTTFNNGSYYEAELGYMSNFSSDTASVTSYGKSLIETYVQNGVGNYNRMTFTDSNFSILQYPNTRVDTATIQPINFLYTDANGQFLSAPVGVIASAADLRLVGAGNHITQDAGASSNGTSVGTGGANIAIGPATLAANTSGGMNVALSQNTLTANTTGNENIAIGSGALQSNVDASFNTSVGSQSLSANTTGTANTALGRSALTANQTGSYNVAAGLYSLYQLTNGSGNIAIGANSGDSLTSGNNNIFIGQAARYNISKTGSNQLNIGNWIYGDAGKIGVNVKAPTNQLHVSAASNPLRLEGLQTGTAADSILTVNATGVVRKIAATAIAAADTTDWNLLGNTGTNSGVNFLGTTDTAALVFRTNNTNRMKIDGVGRVGIGASPLSGLKLLIATDNSEDIASTRFTNTPNDDVDIDFIRGYGSSILAPAVVSDSGARLGGLRGRTYINPATLFTNPITAFAPSAEVAFETDGVPTTTSAPGRIVFQTTTSGSIGTTTKMVLTNNGNLGVGTTNAAIHPDAKLFVDNSNDPSIPVLKLKTPATGAATDSILTWNPADNSVRKVKASSFIGARGRVACTGVASQVISNANVTATSVIIVQYEDPAGGVITTAIGPRVVGASFTVNFSALPPTTAFINYTILP